MAQGSSILLLRSAPAPRGNAAMSTTYDTFALLLAAADCPNGNDLTVDSTQSQWTTKFDNNNDVINFDTLRTNGWGIGSCSAGCGSAGCVNNFCAALGVSPYLL